MTSPSESSTHLSNADSDASPVEEKDEMRRKVETVDNVEDNSFDNPTVVFVFVNRFYNYDNI